jgi:GDPmannose 4,6-dehydratase
MILQHEVPDNFVIATGKSHSVRELCKYVFEKLDMDYNNFVIQDERFLRPEELKYLHGDSTKARITLGWQPEYTFETLLDEMIQHWMEKIK